MIDSWLTPIPIVPILRGITPSEVVAVGEALIGAELRILEIPLNSPEPFASISALAEAFRGRALIGAGTVLKASDVDRVAEAGGNLIVMPHSDLSVIRQAKKLGLFCLPGVATPTEAFAALGAAADGLKLFPAEMLSPAAVTALRAVLPSGTQLFPVGGITPASMQSYVEAGATGFGIGSAIYRPGLSAAAVAERAVAFVEAWRALSPS